MSDASQQFVVFGLGGGEYAFPIAAVSEIIRYTEPRSAATEQPSVRGVISLRGKIIPVLDITARVGAHSSEQAPGKIVIVESADGQVGVVVDDVQEVMHIAVADLDEVPAITKSSIDAVAKLGDRLVMVLQPTMLAVASV